MNTSLIFDYWWTIIPVFALIFYKFTLRFFFGMVIIPEDKIGLVTKKLLVNVAFTY